MRQCSWLRSTSAALTTALVLVLVAGLPPALPAQGNPPEIIANIDFPSKILADGKANAGYVFFKDPDGDIARITFDLVQGNRSSLQLKPDWEFDPHVQGQREGYIPFTISATAAQQVRIRVTLTDAAGNGSQPKEFSFEAVSVTTGAILQVSPTSLSFSSEVGRNPPSQTLQITNTGTGTLAWNASADQSWIGLSSNSGTAPATMTVSVNTAGLTAGSYSGRMTITAAGAQNSPVTVSVSLALSVPLRPAVLEVSPTSLSFRGQEGGSNPSDQMLTIRNAGEQSLTWTAQASVGWLRLSHTTSTLQAGQSTTVQVSVNLEGLSAGTQQAEIRVTAPGAQNSPAIVSVSLQVDSRPSLSVDPQSLQFRGQVGQSNPASQSFRITNTGGGSLNWTASTNVTWLNLTPRSGIAPSTVTVSVSIANLTAGTYEGRITITATLARGSPAIVTVILTLAPPPRVGNPLFVTSNGASFSGTGHGGLFKVDISNLLIPIKTEIVRALDVPADAVCSPEKRIYFAEAYRGKIYRVDPDGRNLTELAAVNRPEGVTFNTNGDLYVSADSGIWRLRRGVGPAEKIASAYSDSAGGLVFLTHGRFAGDLVAVDASGNRVLRFPAPNFNQPVDFITRELDWPIGIALNSKGEVFVGNFNSKKIQHFSAEGTFLETLGERIQLRLYRPIHLEFGPDDTLYAAEWGDYVGQGWIARISTPSGELIMITSIVDAWGVGLC